MNVDTGTFAAITAETAMLRERAARGRHRATARPPRPRRPSVVEAWHAAGYDAAMRDVLDVMNEAAEHAEAAQPDQFRAIVLSAVLAVAEHAVEMHETDTVPPGWAEGGQR